MIGTIEGFEGSWASGLGYLTIRDLNDGKARRIACDNAPTVRALDSMFPRVVVKGHMVNPNALIGKRVQYGLDNGGLLLGWLALPEDEEGKEDAKWGIEE